MPDLHHPRWFQNLEAESEHELEVESGVQKHHYSCVPRLYSIGIPLLTRDPPEYPVSFQAR
jgi:hypothetical protein